MNVFENVLNSIAKRAEPVKGDYYIGDILYCGKCNTPKEVSITFEGFNEERIVRKACNCVMEAEEKERKEAKIKQRRDSIENSLRDLIEIGVARMPRYDFSMCDDSNPDLRKRMQKYAENFDSIYDKNIGLILYGNTGTGKTFFAECIANELIKKGRFAWITSVSEIVNVLSSNKGYNQFIMNYVKNVDLLVLDDFGTERDTSFMSEQLYNIVDARYVAKRPMIITTNIDTQAMMANTNIRIKRIGERLAESCVSIEVKGQTRRVEKAKEKMSQLQEIFGND